MVRARALLCFLACLPVAAACDLEVLSGQTVTLKDGESISGGSRPDAVVVRPGGTLIVEGATVGGRGAAVERSDAVPLLGSAVVSEGGSVRVLRGTLFGGNVMVVANDPNTPPNPPPSSQNTFRFLSPALIASPSGSMPSVVVIEGGSLSSGGQFGGELGTSEFLAASPALFVTGTNLTIRGGEFRRGPAPVDVLEMLLRTELSTVTIGGGSFVGFVSLGSSNSRISDRSGSSVWRSGEPSSSDRGSRTWSSSGFPRGSGSCRRPSPCRSSCSMC